MWESDGTNTRAHALATAPDRDDTRVDGEDPLAAWQWYPASTNDTTTGTYAARYPLSWTRYSGVFAAEVSCEAFSPILPGDYQRSSYPVAVFRWTLRNPSNRPLQLSLLLSWRNTVGWFTNTDPSAEVHFRDDGSPEHNYAPAIGVGEGQSNRWVDQGASAVCCWMVWVHAARRRGGAVVPGVAGHPRGCGGDALQLLDPTGDGSGTVAVLCC